MADISLTVDGNALHHCLERMCVFCALDAYLKYDLKGFELYQEHGDLITEGEVACVRTMSARSPVSDPWASLRGAQEVRALLGLLPTGLNLLQMSNDEWQHVSPVVRRVVARMTAEHGVGLAAATKMLALKRPDLIPPCDSQLVKYFAVRGRTDVDKAIALMERLRRVAAEPGNLPALRAVKAGLAERKVFDRPITLSTTRILEALCWMESGRNEGRGGIWNPNDQYHELWKVMGWQ